MLTVVLVGLVLGCCHRTRQDGERRDCSECQHVHQLPRLSAQEELAERAITLHQDYHGTFRQNLLNIPSTAQ